MKDKVKIITDGAVITAIYALILLLSKFIGGLLEDWLYFILPIPISIYGYKYNLKDSLVVAISTIAIAFIFINPISALFFVVPTIIMGMFYPLIIKKNKGSLIEIIFTTCTSLICNVLSMWLFGYLFEYDIINDTLSLVDNLIKFLNGLGINNIENFLRAVLISLIPASIFLISLMEGIIVQFLTNLILTRLKLKKMALFNQMITLETIPSCVGVVYLVFSAIAIGSIFGLMVDNQVVFILSATIINIWIIFSFFMIYQGIYLISKWSRINNKMWVYAISILVIFIFPIAIIAVGIYQNLSHISLKL